MLVLPTGSGRGLLDIQARARTHTHTKLESTYPHRTPTAALLVLYSRRVYWQAGRTGGGPRSANWWPWDRQWGDTGPVGSSRPLGFCADLDMLHYEILHGHAHETNFKWLYLVLNHAPTDATTQSPRRKTASSPTREKRFLECWSQHGVVM